MDDDLFVFIELVQVVWQCTYKYMLGTIYMVRLVLRSAPYVYQLHVGISDIGFELVDINDVFGFQFQPQFTYAGNIDVAVYLSNPHLFTCYILLLTINCYINRY